MAWIQLSKPGRGSEIEGRRYPDSARGEAGVEEEAYAMSADTESGKREIYSHSQLRFVKFAEVKV